MGLFVHALSRVRAPLVSDGRGGQKRDWGNALIESIPGWAVDAGLTVDDGRNRDGSLVAYTARGPLDADVDASDRIVYDGETYEVDGAVLRQPGPTPRTSHSILLLKRWEG
jgi:hypothetical protein